MRLRLKRWSGDAGWLGIGGDGQHAAGVAEGGNECLTKMLKARSHKCWAAGMDEATGGDGCVMERRRAEEVGSEAHADVDDR